MNKVLAAIDGYFSESDTSVNKVLITVAISNGDFEKSDSERTSAQEGGFEFDEGQDCPLAIAMRKQGYSHVSVGYLIARANGRILYLDCEAKALIREWRHDQSHLPTRVDLTEHP